MLANKNYKNHEACQSATQPSTNLQYLLGVAVLGLNGLAVRGGASE